MKAFLIALSAIGLSLAQVGQVGPNVTQSFDIRELQVRPAVIQISSAFTTLLEFEDLVVRVASAQGDIMTADLRDNFVYLRSLVPTGSTDLLVTVADGRVAMFRVEVDANATAPRRYIIRFPRVSLEPSMSQQLGAAAVEIPSPTPRATAAPEPVVDAVRFHDELPPYLQVRALPLWDGRTLTLNVSLRNNGDRSVIGDPASVRVYSVADDGSRRVVPLRVAGGGRVAPGGSGTLAVTAEGIDGTAELVWRLSEIGSANIWTYRVMLRGDE